MTEPGPVRVAAIDCGTNTIKLLVAESRPGEPLVELVRELRMVRLGQGVDATGMLAPEALERTFAAIDEYAGLIREHGADRVRFVATSATRDSGNADVFAAGVRERLGVDPHVATGDEEARLAFTGAVGNLREAPALPVVVLDIGGGSTELILGRSAAEGPQVASSMDIGSVRLTERILRSDPPTDAEVAACVSEIDAHLDTCPVDPAAAATLVGVAGTVTQLAAGVLGLETYDRAAVDQAVLPAAALWELTERLLTMTVEQRRALPWMHPQRADVIAAGALILTRVLERSRVADLLVSECDILDGIALSLTD